MNPEFLKSSSALRDNIYCCCVVQHVQIVGKRVVGVSLVASVLCSVQPAIVLEEAEEANIAEIIIGDCL